MAEGPLQPERLLQQRALVAQLQSHLPAVNRSVIAFLEQLHARARHISPDPQNTEPETDLPDPSIEEVKDYFTNTVKRLDETATALMGHLQFVESHRGITEAENVTRLTELAFFFIPLSFAASAFSMQIGELTEPVPLWAFLAFGLSLSASSYLVRLVVRSSTTQRLKHSLMTQVRRHNDLPTGGPVPTTAFIAWLSARFGPAVLFAVILLCILAPALSVLWTRELSTGLKAAVTVVLIVSVLLFSVIILCVNDVRKMVMRGVEYSWFKRGTVEHDEVALGISSEQPKQRENRKKHILKRVFGSYINKDARNSS
ncbi:hypothetical protein AJ80_08304 [Polytolypa hystricis UAMH7299]|uniref:Uncharacterized protein n=1 Tax=Polytolypa hystricis (strain UAMH7299) TaxID=1447883 RepID=A0A2B7XA54_POLH7|nr:hypothetical protein AJ80_08304 [Polytolypa hystricis UAMH7299]